MKKPLVLPKFKDEDEEREFWSNIDLSEYYEPSDLQSVSFPNLKPSTKPISIRLPSFTLNSVKERANVLDVPYQALIKQYIAKGLAEDFPYPLGNKSRKTLRGLAVSQ